MTTVEINNTTEAKQKLHDALNILDAISAYSINHQLPSDQLFDIEVRKRLQNLYPKSPSPIHPLLRESDELSEDEKKTLSPYCYKIGNWADDFDDVLGGLEAYYKQMNAQNLTNKGELIDTIIRGSVSKTIKSVAGILDVIGSLALWHIREVEARTLASERGHKLVSQEDKSNAATEMWQHLASYNINADRAKLDARISAGIRWDRFLGRSEIGMIVVVHKLPLSLKFPTKLMLKLALIVTEMPGILDQAKMATPCVQKLLDSRLGPWTGPKKRKLQPGAEVESGTPCNHSNSIGALLNAAEHIAAAIQGQQLLSPRESSISDQIALNPPESLAAEGSYSFTGESGWDATTSCHLGIRSNEGESRGLEPQGEALDPPRKRMRIDSFLLSNGDRGSNVTAQAPDVNLQVENVSSLGSPDSQPSGGHLSDQAGTTAETSPEDTNFIAPQAQDDSQVEGRNVAEVAEVEKLEVVIGCDFFNGMEAGLTRKGEKDQGRISFTETVRLHLAYHQSDDFKLEIWLCSSMGKAILQAKMESVEDLRSILGDYLFTAMKTSNRRKGEGRSNCTTAVDVSFPSGDNGSDCKVEVMIGFAMGIRIFKDIYPRII